MTILFRDDWKKYPDAIIDTQTTNKSFIRFSALLRDMGIKNHAFMLALLNPALQGINPFDPDLTLEQMAAIAVEAKTNFFYFVREIARAPGRAGADDIPFKANRGNMCLFWLFFNHITTILIQIRQTGKSFSSDTLMTYLMNIRCRDTSINLLTKDDILRAANIERLKDISNTLPYYLRQRNRNDTNNTEEFTIRNLGNSYKGHLPSKSPKQALNVGRGLTSPIFQIDEAAMLFNIAISLPAALAAGTAARDIARQNDEPYGTILTTTAGKKDDPDGRYVHQLLIRSAVWNEAMYDCENREELEKLIRRNSGRDDQLASSSMGVTSRGDLRVNATFNHRQLGYTDEWLMRAIEEAIVTGEAADRDFFNVWTSGTMLSPLPVDILNMIRQSQVVDFYPQINAPYGYILRWYIPESQIKAHLSRTHVTIGNDSSDAVGGDDIGLVIRDIKDGSLLAAGNFNETNLITYADWIVNFLIENENSTYIIERRSTGAMILDYVILKLLSKGIDPFKRIYNRVVQEAEEYPDRFAEINKPMFSRDQDVYVRFKKYFGFATSATGSTSRTELYSTTLLAAAKYTGENVRDTMTIDQIVSLTVRNGRVDHGEGEHDDMVISWLLSYWLLSQGKNLSFYGIDSRDVLSQTKHNKQHNTPESRYNQHLQDNLRKEIEDLVAEIQKERDEFICQKLEMKLRNLSTKLVLRENEHFSIDGMINGLREQRKMSRSQMSYGNVGANRIQLPMNSGITRQFGR